MLKCANQATWPIRRKLDQAQLPQRELVVFLGAVWGSHRWVPAGDWTCPQCNDLQFARNAVCRRCGDGGEMVEIY